MGKEELARLYERVKIHELFKYSKIGSDRELYCILDIKLVFWWEKPLQTKRENVLNMLQHLKQSI